MLLNGGYGYRSLPVLGVAAMIVAAAVALSSLIAEQRTGLRPPAPAGRLAAPQC
jgi:DHA1 family inner membrane transport protein